MFFHSYIKNSRLGGYFLYMSEKFLIIVEL